MAINYELLGKRIAMLRSRNDISQNELCDAINLSRDYLAHIETGKKHPMYLSFLPIAGKFDSYTVEAVC